MCVTGPSSFPRYVLCELVFRLRYECLLTEDKNLFISFSLIHFISKCVAEMRFKICTIWKSKYEFVTKVTKNSEMYYVASVSLNFTTIIRNFIEITKERTNERTKQTNKQTNKPNQSNQLNQLNQPNEPNQLTNLPINQSNQPTKPTTPTYQTSQLKAFHILTFYLISL